MSFRTELNIGQTDWRIDHNSKILCLGSCFADEIGSRLQQSKFPTLVNPFGIIYHPAPLIDLLKGFLQSEDAFLEVLTPTIFNREGTWGSFSLPGTHLSREQLLNHIRGIHQKMSGYLPNADYLILTFGTAIGFYHEKLERTVANCHKFPDKDFKRIMDGSDGMYEQVSAALKKLIEINPGLKIMVTVSPVRHIRSGLVNNSASKSLLRVLCFELESSMNEVQYFPAYELMMDDLRDYRFYKPDMIHPNGVAVDYIWEKLGGSYFSEETRTLTGKIEQVRRDLAHRPMQPQSLAYKKFLVQLESKINQLASQVNMDAELESLSQMKNPRQPD